MEPRKLLTQETRFSDLVKPQDVYTVEPGRNIYRNGEPFVTIQRPAQQTSGATPSEADDITHVIAALLNARQPVKGDRS